MTEHCECEHYEIFQFTLADNHPDWWPTGEIFRTRANAETYVAQENARLLGLKNDGARRHHEKSVQVYREHRALVAALMRDKNECPADPGQFTPATELGRWDERYRCEKVVFEDD